MTSERSESSAFRLLILAPFGRDAELLQKIAFQQGIEAVPCRRIEEFVDDFHKGAGAVVITEEALYLHNVSQLFRAIEQQPAWSEVPFIVLASRSSAEQRAHKTFQLTRPLRNVTLIERPARPSTLINAFDGVLRDRRRQYEVRDTLLELEESQKALRALNEELEQRVHERTQRLQLAVRELEGFTYSVAHDLRAPVRGVISQARIILEDFGDKVPEDARSYLERLTEAASKMGALVEDLLKYARLEERNPKRCSFDLCELARDVADAVTEETECVIDLRTPPNIVVQADRELLRLVLYNLFHNSCKYRGEDEVRIELDAVIRDGRTAYCIKDNGIGFDGKYAHKLFRPFERLHRDEHYPGTGIGLANVKRIIELHGGEVWAEGIPGDGASFFFTLGE